MASNLKPGDKVFILPKTQYNWEWAAPKGIQTIKTIEPTASKRSYVTLREAAHVFLIERCILADSVAPLERIIYGFES